MAYQNMVLSTIGRPYNCQYPYGEAQALFVAKSTIPILGYNVETVVTTGSCKACDEWPPLVRVRNILILQEICRSR